MSKEKEPDSWDGKSWLWVLLCLIGIFSIIPLARYLQKFVYTTFGKEIFTYAVFAVIFVTIIILLYFFIFRLKIANPSQYVWLLSCAGLCIYFTIRLRQHPEEAFHILEYGLLSVLIFRALSYRIQDWTVYVSTILLVLFFGTLDEFVQWMMPKRYWGLKDIGINTLAAVIFQLAVLKGIRPEKISRPVSIYSVKMLTGIAALNLLFLGICFSNTPEAVKYYTSISEKLSWLRNEETMTEYGYKHEDPELGTFYSRFTLEELREMDRKEGNNPGGIMTEGINPESTSKELMETYNPNTNKFLYEFFVHVSHRDDELKTVMGTKSTGSSLKAFKENLILEKYFGSTLNNSRFALPPGAIEAPDHVNSLVQKEYVSKVGRLITLFNIQTARTVIFVLLFILLVGGELWKRKIDT